MQRPGLTLMYPSEYSTWENMKQRCNNTKCISYHNYGGRGITVCDRWNAFQNFIEDMGPKPTHNSSIDRINNNLGYTKENCRWSTPIQQARNTRNTIYIEYQNKRYTLAELAEILQVPRGTLYRRIARGESQSIWNRPTNRTGQLSATSRITGIPKSTLLNRMRRNNLTLQEAAYEWATIKE